MKLILHAGMHKTGSSSIQQAIFTAQSPVFRGVTWRDAKVSNLFVLLFEDNPADSGWFRLQGIGPQDIPRLRAEALLTLDEDIRRAAGQGQSLVFSAERIATAPDAALVRMQTHFAARGVEVQVYGYVRPPVPYVTRMFQQSVKTGLSAFKLPWPRYQRTFGRLDRLFGAQAVRLRVYRKDRLTAQDAVVDFFDWAGLGRAPVMPLAENASLSAAATACLFALRQALAAGADPEPDRVQSLMRSIRAFKSGGFALDAGLLRTMIARHAGDLDWIDRRLGQTLHAEADFASSASQEVFGSAEELIAFALAHVATCGRALSAPDRASFLQAVLGRLDQQH